MNSSASCDVRENNYSGMKATLIGSPPRDEDLALLGSPDVLAGGLSGSWVRVKIGCQSAAICVRNKRLSNC